MKKGDKLYCKKSKGDAFKKGDWYTVDIVDVNYITVVSDLVYHASSTNLITHPYIERFLKFNGKLVKARINDEYVWEFFYSKKELRKLKLDEIENL